MQREQKPNTNAPPSFTTTTSNLRKDFRTPQQESPTINPAASRSSGDQSGSLSSQTHRESTAAGVIISGTSNIVVPSSQAKLVKQQNSWNGGGLPGSQNGSRTPGTLKVAEIVSSEDPRSQERKQVNSLNESSQAHTKGRSDSVTAQNKILKERLGIENLQELGELIIQLQGYSGAAAANASNADYAQQTKQQLKFKDLYLNPQIIGQGAFGLVVRVQRQANATHKQQIKNLNKPVPASSLNARVAQYNIKIKRPPSSASQIASDDVPAIQYVAVKVINKKELNEGGYQVLKNEALILREMDHPNIVKFNDIFETTEFIFIEMEFIPHGTLRQLMNSKAGSLVPKSPGSRCGFTDFEVSQIMGGLLSAVNHVHSKNYVHRDLKPENVLIGDPRSRGSNKLSGDGLSSPSSGSSPADQGDLRKSIKLADFGLSASFRISMAHSLDERMGTLLFMAPEQTKNQTYGKKIDMWACGIIMYLLIENRHPIYISGVDNAQTYPEKLTKCNPAKWATEEGGGKNFTPMARDLFAKLCNPMPIERYTAEQALRHPWITRDFNSPIPITESQKMREVQAESLLRNALHVTFFLSVAKLRRNTKSLDFKHSQQSTSSSSCSGSTGGGGIILSEYLARCERFIIEQEEEVQQKRKAEIETEEQLKLASATTDESPTVIGGQGEKIEPFIGTSDPSTDNSPQPIALAGQKNMHFEFDRGSNSTKQGEDQAAKKPVNLTNQNPIKKVSTFIKKISSTAPSQQQPAQQNQQVVIKKANVHFQQLYGDDEDPEESSPFVITGPSAKRKSAVIDKPHSSVVFQSQGESKSHQSASPTKRVGAAIMSHQGQYEQSSPDQVNMMSGTKKKKSSAFHTESDSAHGGSPNYRFGQPQHPQTEIKRKNATFELNLHSMGKPNKQVTSSDDEEEGSKTPHEFDQPQVASDQINGGQGQKNMASPSKVKSKSKNQKRKLVELGSHNSNNMGQIGPERMSSQDISKLYSHKSKSQNPSGNGGTSIKKKRQVVGASPSIKHKKLSDLQQIQNNQELLDEGDFDQLYHFQQLMSVQQQNQIQQPGGGQPGNSSFIFDDKNASTLQQNQMKVKSVLQTRASKQAVPHLQLPQIVPNDEITNRKQALVEEWSQAATGSVKKKPGSNSKAQKSLENVGQRTHNQFFNHHSQQNQLFDSGFPGGAPSDFQNYPHSFIQPSALSQQFPPQFIEMRRQSTNYSAMDNAKSQLQNESFFKAYPQQQIQQVANQNNFDFLQFQQKYLQWREQRTSAVLQQQKPQGLSGQERTGKKQGNVSGIFDQQHSSYIIHSTTNDHSDDFLLMAAKGASLKQQRSSATVGQNSVNMSQMVTNNQPKSTSHNLNQDFIDVSAANIIFHSTQQQQDKVPSQINFSDFKIKGGSGVVQRNDTDSVDNLKQGLSMNSRSQISSQKDDKLAVVPSYQPSRDESQLSQNAKQSQVPFPMETSHNRTRRINIVQNIDNSSNHIMIVGNGQQMLSADSTYQNTNAAGFIASNVNGSKTNNSQGSSVQIIGTRHKKSR